MKNKLPLYPKLLKAILILFASSIALLAEAQTISGYVTDGKTNTPLQGAIVTVFSDKDTQFYETGLDGFYQIDLYAGTYTLSCSRFGYETSLIENIRLEYDKIEVVDVKLFMADSKTQAEEKVSEEKSVFQTFENNTDQNNQSNETIAADKHSSVHFRKNALISVGLGYQLGEIGGINGSFGLSLSRVFGGSEASSNIFLIVDGGYQQKNYSSALFNDVNQTYQFDFLHFDGGLQKIFMASDRILIAPSVSFGLEQAKPKTTNVHQLIDDGYIYAFYFKPTLMLGYAVSPGFVLNIKASYYAMMNETANKDNLILAEKGSGADDWQPYHYADDFFLKRKGFSVSLGLSIFF